MQTALGRALIFSTALLAPKTTRATQGVNVVTLKKKDTVETAQFLTEGMIANESRYRVRSVPAAGALLKGEDVGEVQLTLE